ncbi:MAG: GMC family oxidoreductase [Planctomycetales bacterium]|nr:GMC family oxidoreductase [Planctomycetales bacterium]
MLITSLANCADQSVLEFDVCVVGAGAAGIYSAVRLANLGLNVGVVDAGPTETVAPDAVGYIAEFGDQFYNGAVDGRAFGFGGTTSRWGGVLIPHSNHDVRGNDEPCWKHISETVAREKRAVLVGLGAKNHDDFDRYPARLLPDVTGELSEVGIDMMASLFLPFRTKNLSTLARKCKANLSVYTDATASDWKIVDENVTSLRLRTLTRLEHEVRARWFILAAGTLESARSLLEIQAKYPGLLQSEILGRGLGDHLSTAVASVDVSDGKRCLDLFAPRFERGWMRSFRFLDRNQNHQTRAFAHFVFDNRNAGFALAKKVLTSLQARRVPKLRIAEIVTGLAGVSGLAYSRYVRNRLHIPQSTDMKLQLDVEQPFDPSNRIVLSNATDGYGRRRLIINWKIGDHAATQIDRIADEFVRRWNRSKLPKLTRASVSLSGQKPHDAFHPVGACRLGPSEEYPVGFDLSVNTVRNLSVLCTGVLPTAGSANPTFSMLCLGEVLCRRIGTLIGN